MTGAQTPEAMSPKLLKVMQRAKRDPEARFTSLAHLLDEDALRRAHGRIRHTERAWHKWLSRRSQKTMSWERFKELLRVFPLPRLRVYVQLWRPA